MFVCGTAARIVLGKTPSVQRRSRPAPQSSRPPPRRVLLSSLPAESRPPPPGLPAMSLWATKSITALRAEAEATGDKSLKRTLGPFNLVTLGVGAVIGAGIFVLTGQAAALYAGPAVPISMALVGSACAFAGLCYAEMASAVPVA